MTSPAGCQNPAGQTGGECTSELEGSIEGNRVNNADAEVEDAGIDATLTADYAQVTSPAPGTFSALTTGTATLTDADGSTIEFDREGDYTGNNDGTGATVFGGTFTVVGGTGRFEGAAGSGDITATTTNGQFVAELDGTLVLPEPPDPNACTVTGTDSDDELEGTNGRDVICGRGGDDTISGAGGDDVIRAGEGKDTVRGGSGDDDVLGGPGMDTLYGGPGRDMLEGGAGQDVERQ